MKCDKCGKNIYEWETYYIGKLKEKTVFTLCISCYMKEKSGNSTRKVRKVKASNIKLNMDLLQ